MNPNSLRVDTLDAAILDLDGTMVDTLGDFEAAVAAMLAELHLSTVSRDEVARGVGWGSEHLIRMMLQRVGAEPSRFDEAWESYQRHYLAVNGRHARVYPGVHEGLERFAAAGIKLACVTNKPAAFIRPLLSTLALEHHFEVVFGGDSLARRKPDPLPLVEACRAMGTLPARTLMIGDSAVDAQAARAAGCPVALVRYGFNHGQSLDTLGVERLVDRIDELLV